jgi:FtsP/CotA-like multicopper oxidase with cupredoxin domain
MSRVDYDLAADVTEYLETRLSDTIADDAAVSRRAVLGGIGAAGAGLLASGSGAASSDHGSGGDDGGSHGHFGSTGEYQGSEFDPHGFLREFNTGRDGGDNVAQRVSQEDGQTVREFDFTVVDTTIEVAPGVEFPVWAYNDQVPGPTIRATEGDLIRINLTNGSAHAHTIHPHVKNINPRMDGIPTNGPGVLEPGDSFTYEWQAEPMGCHLYHCHSLPLKEHIHRGMYGALIVDPDPERVRQNPEDYVNCHGSQITDEMVDDLVARARSRNHEYDENDEYQELVMVMNGFDTNFDGDNEVYAANTRAFAYGVGDTDGQGNWEAGETIRPIQIDGQQPVRVYVVNTIEFDPINSFHTHSQFFDYYDHGTTLLPTHRTVDTIMQCQAQRGIIELDYSDHEPGLYMFHAHQSEFAELGWMSFFEVV